MMMNKLSGFLDDSDDDEMEEGEEVERELAAARAANSVKLSNKNDSAVSVTEGRHLYTILEDGDKPSSSEEESSSEDQAAGC